MYFEFPKSWPCAVGFAGGLRWRDTAGGTRPLCGSLLGALHATTSGQGILNNRYTTSGTSIATDTTGAVEASWSEVVHLQPEVGACL